MRALTLDVRHGLRRLRAEPGFTAVAVLTLALGIGATTAVFSVVNAVMLRPPPYPDPGRLVVPVPVNLARDIARGSITYADYADWRALPEVFDAVALVRTRDVDLTGHGAPERVAIGVVSATYFDVFRTRPILGRPFLPGEESPAGELVCVLSEALWARRYGGARDILGTPVTVNGVPATVVGVMPPRAGWPDDVALWLPVRVDPGHEDQQRRDNMTWRAVARLRADVGLATARARVKTIASRLEVELPGSRQGWTNDLVPLGVYRVEPETRRALGLVTGAVALVLLISCVNVASLLTARAVTRAPEVALRHALGASRQRVFRQLLTESAVLAALGGAAGLAAAWAMTRVLQSLAPAGALPADATGLDPRATATALAAACLTALAFGMLPAWSASSIAPGAGLRDGERTTGTAGTERIRGLLVAGEVALAIVLLCGAVLLVRSVQRLERADPGVVTAGVVAAPITLPAARYAEDADVRRFYRELVDRLERIPGIESASAVSRLPAGGPGFGLGRVFLVDGAPEPPAGPDYPAMWNVVTPRYFATVRQALVKGRGFTDDDTAESRPVVVIGEAMARRMFPGADPIGRRIRSWRDENLLREVVGVVGDVRYFGAGDELRPMVYVPHAQNPWSVMLVAARVGGDPRAFAAALRREVAAVDPELAIGEAGTLEGHRTASMAGPRFTTAILAAFAGTALVLTLAGIYGLMAYVVAQRRRELGVRVALGARPVDLRLAVLGRAAAVTMAGTIGGLACAVLSSRLVESFVFEASSRDLVAFGWVAALLLAAALSASLVPAERAARVDAVSALRGE